MSPERIHRQYTKIPDPLGPSHVGPTDTHALIFLTRAEMGEGWLMPYASNYTFLVELCHNEQHGYGIYKPQAGEAPLWDFPSGTLYRRECASYSVSRMLGWPMVPPTVQREGELGIGSLQLFVPSVEQSHYFALRETRAPELFRMAVFDVMVNNADRKGGHCFEAKSGGIWGIDHGLTFHVAYKLRTVIWDFAGERIAEPLLQDLRRLADELNTPGSAALAELAELLAPEEVMALVWRIDQLLKEPAMPEPRSRRDLPWPWL